MGRPRILESRCAVRLPSFPYTEIRDQPVRIVDLRSPTEYARDHLPGAVNVPLFDDAQRALVGTLYKHDSPQQAFDRGLEMVEAGMDDLLSQILPGKIPRSQWLAEFQRIALHLRDGLSAPADSSEVGLPLAVLGDQPLILHCWRGGMRSRSVALLLRALGEAQVGMLEGGYKNYRRWVLAELNNLPKEKLRLVVLRGQTGVGKTEILHRLEILQPGCTLDLEGLASHRSSVLGAVGLDPVSQPMFDSLLLDRLQQLKSPFLVEGESRKVGNIELPEKLYRAMCGAPQVRIFAPLDYRIELLGRDYLATPQRLAQTITSLVSLQKQLGKKLVAEMQSQIHQGEWKLAARTLLERHYDPLYGRDDVHRSWLAEFDATGAGLEQKLIDLLD
jgi:tRNA 2-selenouridine synthase